MSNEEMAVRIQEGKRELLPELWEQVRRFVMAQAGGFWPARGGAVTLAG